MSHFPAKTSLAILTAGLLLLVVHAVAPAVPAFDVHLVASLAAPSPDVAPMFPWVEPPPPEPPAPPRKPEAIRQRLLDDVNGGLDYFYQSLWRTERREPGAKVRVVHYGDSPTTADLITADIRSLLQSRFGNAGHGFTLVSKPWAWYQHSGVELTASGWTMSAASQFEVRDGLFGLGGVSLTAEPGAQSHIRLAQPGQTQLEIYYLGCPGCGTLVLSAGGQELGRLSTEAEQKTALFAPYQLPPAVREFELTVEDGPVRVFGVTTERPGPGLVYDSLGMNGASITVLARIVNAAHWAGQLQHRRPDLVVINYGTNEADFDSFVDKEYEGELRQAIRRIRAALPAAAILVMSPMDRARRAASGAIETMPTIPRIVAIQRRVAAETGCGFFDTYMAMGGEGTMARWYAAKPRLVSADFIHPYPAGGKIIAAIFAREIELGLVRFKSRQPAQKPAVTAVR